MERKFREIVYKVKERSQLETAKNLDQGKACRGRELMLSVSEECQRKLLSTLSCTLYPSTLDIMVAYTRPYLSALQHE